MLQPSYIPFLVAGMLLTGCSNSLLSKWQDMICVEGCTPADNRPMVLFEQPVWQTLQMFVGEMLCFLPVLAQYLLSRRHIRLEESGLPEEVDGQEVAQNGNVDADADGVRVEKAKPMTGWTLCLLFFPAFFDICGTTLMNVGLLYTPVSIYQMTRGALVLWVGLFSVLFLRRRLWIYQWLALMTVMGGVCVVGVAGSLAKERGIIPQKPEEVGEAIRVVARWLVKVRAEREEKPATAVAVGVLFVLFAQIFTACQFVVEEKIMERYSVGPLLAVGMEGLFGTLTTLAAMPILSLFASHSPFFDFPRGWDQIIHSQPVIRGSVAIALSIALFNFFGLSVTRHVSATARSTTDTCRTLGIWLVSLGLGWEHLTYPWSILQVTGFALLVYGTFLFNNLVSPPSFLRPHTVVPPIEGAEEALGEEEREEERGLLSEQVLRDTAALPADLGQGGFDVEPAPRSPSVHVRTE
ncbi:hypothetical protein DACRYDRAFT_76280 [Dacryopinax primogenitus]|uniref:Integral membrane protein n=1 Tax=Dacryopinax primogenitus (strain DJM 731) TaxID=1858805 RepID=M5GCQ5_DACPD|nr:uncharacterized protein DACRYDRAFT_76280 [Dacryopinax primogenitus]EJU04002.1 hypothetical protein DACRYDRAFT_76280 [Dacryopinax primogenitus]